MFFLNLKYFLFQFKVGQCSYLHGYILSHFNLARAEFHGEEEYWILLIDRCAHILDEDVVDGWNQSYLHEHITM
jgi:hypothetical protein